MSGCGRFEEKEREKGCVFASVIFVNSRYISTLQSSSGGILRGWESMFKFLFGDKEVEMYVLIYAMVLRNIANIVLLKLL